MWFLDKDGNESLSEGGMVARVGKLNLPKSPTPNASADEGDCTDDPRCGTPPFLPCCAVGEITVLSSREPEWSTAFTDPVDTAIEYPFFTKWGVIVINKGDLDDWEPQCDPAAEAAVREEAARICAFVGCTTIKWSYDSNGCLAGFLTVLNPRVPTPVGPLEPSIDCPLGIDCA